MMYRFIKTLNLLLLSLFFVLGAKKGSAHKIPINQQVYLDSIVTYIPKMYLKNLDSLHTYLHDNVSTDYERAYLYYAVFAIHYRYDIARTKLKKKYIKEYTTYYTVYTKKGVCRDFAMLYKELCSRSNIPCIFVVGRVKTNFFGVVKEFSRLNFFTPNHAWNLVKIDSSWKYVDVTWGRVNREIKKSYFLSNGKKEKSKIKIVEGKYFDDSFENFYNKRKAIHPAFYAQDTVFTYKSSFKKIENRKVYNDNYDYEKELQKLYENPYYIYSTTFNQNGHVYSKFKSSGTLNFHILCSPQKLKRSALDPLDKDFHQEHYEFLKSLKENDLDAFYKMYLFQITKQFEEKYSKLIQK